MILEQAGLGFLFLNDIGGPGDSISTEVQILIPKRDSRPGNNFRRGSYSYSETRLGPGEMIPTEVGDGCPQLPNNANRISFLSVCDSGAELEVQAREAPYNTLIKIIH